MHALLVFAQESQPSTAPTQAVASGAAITVLVTSKWITIFFVGLGATVAFAAVAYAIRVRRYPSAFVQAILGGGFASSAAAALGTKIAGLPQPITVAQAAMLAGLGFMSGLIVWLVLFVGVFWFTVTRPLARRYGRAQAMRAWIEFMSGIESLRHWIAHTVKDLNGDRTWDEFACAALHVRDLFVPDGGDSDPSDDDTLIEQLIDARTDFEPSEIQELMMVLVAQRLEEMLEPLMARLQLSTLRFSVWRVHPTEDVLQHLGTFPSVRGQRAGGRAKSDLPLWRDRFKAFPGCLAAEAMLCRSYCTTNAVDRRPWWKKGKLGVEYDAIGGMPMPCDGHAEGAQDNDVWGVVCVEPLGNGIPIDSHLMRLLVARIAREVHADVGRLAPRALQVPKAVVTLPNPPKPPIVQAPEPPLTGEGNVPTEPPPDRNEGSGAKSDGAPLPT